MQNNPFAQQPVLITGGLGFIGSHLAARLLALGARVTLVDSLVPAYGGNWHNIAPLQAAASTAALRVNISDVRDPYSFAHLIRGQAYLFNLAGQTSHLDSMHQPETDLAINCQAQLSILEACRQYNPTVRVVFASTRQIYGKPHYLPVDEAHPLQPVDINGIHKIAGEQYHLLYHQVYGVPTCALRLTNTYGPHMRIKDARQTFLGIWIRQVVQGLPFEVWEGAQWRDFNYVSDVVDALLLAATHPAAIGQVFNLGAAPAIQLDALAALLVDVAGAGSYSVRPFPSERKAIDIGDYYSDYRKAQRMLGWQPLVSLAQGLAQTVAFYRANLTHYLD